MQQPGCRSGVRAAARGRPAPREDGAHQAAPRAEAAYARGASDRRRSPKHAPAARGGRRSRPNRAGRDARAQPAGASRGAIRSRSGRGGREAGSRAWGGAGPSRARDGAEAGGLRATLDVQRTAVSAPRDGGGWLDVLLVRRESDVATVGRVTCASESRR